MIEFDLLRPFKINKKRVFVFKIFSKKSIKTKIPLIIHTIDKFDRWILVQERLQK